MPLWESFDDFKSWVNQHFEESKQWIERRYEEGQSIAEETFTKLQDAKNPKEVLKTLRDAGSSIIAWLFIEDKILIFGPYGSGKTSLIGFFRKRSAIIGEHNPTAGVVKVDHNIVLEGKWQRIERDIGGDDQYRHLWSQQVKSVDPYAIIYMLDGRKSFSEVEQDMRECLQDSLSDYNKEQGNLRLIYVFVNFYDEWKQDKRKVSLLCSKVQIAASEYLYGVLELEGFEPKAYKTHINPKANDWPELQDALKTLSIALLRVSQVDENGSHE